MLIILVTWRSKGRRLISNSKCQRLVISLVLPTANITVMIEQCEKKERISGRIFFLSLSLKIVCFESQKHLEIFFQFLLFVIAAVPASPIKKKKKKNERCLAKIWLIILFTNGHLKINVVFRKLFAKKNILSKLLQKTRGKT